MGQKITKIGIRFSDNDFFQTFHGVLTTLFAAYQHAGGLPTEKHQLLRIINAITYPHYLLFQNQYEYNAEKSGEWDERENSTGKYLLLEEKNIYINDEVDQFIEEHDWYNSEFHVLDTTLYNNNIYSL